MLLSHTRKCPVPKCGPLNPQTLIARHLQLGGGLVQQADVADEPRLQRDGCGCRKQQVTQRLLSTGPRLQPVSCACAR